jgi:hypothetical protein
MKSRSTSSSKPERMRAEILVSVFPELARVAADDLAARVLRYEKEIDGLNRLLWQQADEPRAKSRRHPRRRGDPTDFPF